MHPPCNNYFEDKTQDKQYVPLDNPHPQRNDVTIIAAPGNAFPKELYEPFWEDLLRAAKSRNFRIRSIWMADAANQGASGVLNEDRLGNEPSLADYARDILHLINVKRAEMPRPIIGIGHSMGGQYLAGASLFHPRLFASLILLDPILQARFVERRPGEVDLRPLQFATFRKKTWPSRDAAWAELKKSPFHRSWDPRVLDRWMQYGLREIPSSAHSCGDAGAGIDTNTDGTPVTLTTTPSQEALTFMRPNFEGYGIDATPINLKTHADLDPKWPHIYPFNNASIHAVFERLPSLRPSTLYIFASASTISDASQNAAKLAATGTGVGGSGGVPAGRVKGATLEGVGHLIPFEAATRTADIAGEWIERELEVWKRDEDEFRSTWSRKSEREKREVDDRWIQMVKSGGRGAWQKAKESKI